MKPSIIYKKNFWNKKILNWEQQRYKHGNWGSTIRYRKEIALETLKPFVKNMRILELGCGSGHTAQELINYGAKSYTGLDFSSVAINEASNNLKELISGNKIQYKEDSCKNLQNYEYDIVFSLGLLDWLDSEEIENLFNQSQNKKFLHSFSEDRNSLQQYFHKIFIYLTYNKKQRIYTPNYHSSEEINSLSHNNTYFIRDSRLSFGTFFTNLEDCLLYTSPSPRD